MRFEALGIYFVNLEIVPHAFGNFHVLHLTAIERYLVSAVAYCQGKRAGNTGKPVGVYIIVGDKGRFRIPAYCRLRECCMVIGYASRPDNIISRNNSIACIEG